MIQLRKQNTKRIIVEAREIKGLVCPEDFWGYCTLINEINAGGYLHLSWYSKGNLIPACLVADWQGKHAEKREASSARQVQGVINWLICHSPARALEGVIGREMRRSQQRRRVFAAVSSTYLGGGISRPVRRSQQRGRVFAAVSSTYRGGGISRPGVVGCRFGYIVCVSLFLSSEWRAHVSKLEVPPFFRQEAALFNAGVRAMSVCLP